MYKNKKWPPILKNGSSLKFLQFELITYGRHSYLVSTVGPEPASQCLFLSVPLFSFNALCTCNWFYFIRCVRQSPSPCSSLTIWWRELDWNWSFWRWWICVFTNLASLLTRYFLWARWLHTAFPWTSSNPSFFPAPTPISFAKFIITQSLALTTVGPPLQIMEMCFHSQVILGSTQRIKCVQENSIPDEKRHMP